MWGYWVNSSGICVAGIPGNPATTFTPAFTAPVVTAELPLM
jgi:hypothetical protein